MEQLIKIVEFILDSYIDVWPYLLVTIPMAVAVQLLGAAKFINKALTQNPLVSILLATLVGAFSPFCSCGVIPVIASLLIWGVPLAPVMSFWIASPSMDPEIFFLSTATIGWNLSVWRLIATFVISLTAGYATHIAFHRGWLGSTVLRDNKNPAVIKSVKNIGSEIFVWVKTSFFTKKTSKNMTLQMVSTKNLNNSKINCCIPADTLKLHRNISNEPAKEACGCNEKAEPKIASLKKRLILESWKATVLVAKFMTLAFFINALIHFYVPQDFISKLLGNNSSFSVLIAALVGIPVYTSNITALPLISGLLSLGVNQGAALAFLISGPVTTLPAMVAVWGIVRNKIFILYISFALIGAIIFGVLYNLIY